MGVSQLVAEVLHALNIISYRASRQDLVDEVNVRRNQAVAEALASRNDSFLNVKLEIYQGPGELMLQTVGEVRRLTKAPVPIRRLVVDLHELRDLLQVLHLQLLPVDSSSSVPLPDESILEAVTERVVVDGRSQLIEVDDSRNHRVNAL